MQEHLPFHESNRAEPVAPSGEEIPQDALQLDSFSGQKLTFPEHPSVAQRLALAMASLLVWACAFFVATGVFVGVGWKPPLGAVLLFCLFLLMILLSAINTAFHHLQAPFVANPTSPQRLVLASTSVISWVSITVLMVVFVVLPINHWEKITVGIFLLCGLALFTLLLSILNLVFNRSHSFK